MCVLFVGALFAVAYALIPGVSTALSKWGHDPFALGNDQAFFKVHGDSSGKL